MRRRSGCHLINSWRTNSTQHTTAKLCYAPSFSPSLTLFIYMLLLSKGLTDPGCVRSQNEDRIFFDDSLALYIVCDGIGGRRRGEVAAQLATNTIRQYIESSNNPMEVTWPYGYNLQMSLAANRILTAAKLANRQVWRRSEESLECLGMGTTISAVLFDETGAAIVNIGDSRVYLLRSGALEQLSQDDTIAGTYANTTEIEHARYAEMRNVLTRAAGSQENAEVHLREMRIEYGDRILLCSDGLHRSVADSQIGAMLAAAENPSAAATALIDAALAAGAPDNVSVVVVIGYHTDEPG